MQANRLETKLLVAIEGGIGAGKSTTARIVARSLQLHVALEESSQHPFVEAFYSDPRRYALETEIAFVLLHYHQLKRTGSAPAVTDFSIVKDLVFAELSLNEHEMIVFRSVYDWVLGELGRPQLVVFLELEPEVLLERIWHRGREYELGITKEFLARLLQQYERHVQDLGDQVIRLRINGSEPHEIVADRVEGLIRTWRDERGAQ